MKSFLTISLVFLGAAFSTSNSLRAEGQQTSHQQDETVLMSDSSETGHHHRTKEISEGQPVPDVDLIVHQDPVNGWNLEIQLDNFAFAPESINETSQPNEGHAHLHINGEKVTRIYGNWYHLPELPTGSNELSIYLNTNNHEYLMYQGNAIEDTEIVNVQ